MSLFDKKDPRDQGLEIDVIAGRLVISIGIDILVHAVQHGSDWDNDTVTITDPDCLAQEIATQLEEEEEDGTTLVHRALDRAACRAVDRGSEAVDIL